MDPVFRLDAGDDEPSLSFDCGELPAAEVILAAGCEPNGYFWEGVLHFEAPALAGELELDSEADMFCAYGEVALLEQARAILQTYLSDGDAVNDLIRRAEAAGVDLEDVVEPDGEAPKRSSIFSRLWRRG